MRSQWFVIHTLSGQEQKVKESIEKRIKTEEMQDYIQEVLVPMEKVAEIRNGKKTVTSRKLYPGYVFIDIVLLDENQKVVEKPWYFIREKGRRHWPPVRSPLLAEPALGASGY